MRRVHRERARRAPGQGVLAGHHGRLPAESENHPSSVTRTPEAPRPRALTVRLRCPVGPVRPAALLSAGDLFAPSERLRHPGHPRRPGGRPGHGLGRGADLPDVDLQAGRRRRAARRVRVLALRQPDPDRARGVLRRARGRRRAASRSPVGLAGQDTVAARAARARRPRRRAQRRLRRHLPATSTGSLGPWGIDHSRRLDPRRRRRCARRSGRASPSWSGSRRRPTRCSASPTSPASPRSPTPRARCSSSTTPSRRRYLQQPDRARRRHRRRTPRPSTRVATATSSAAPS